MIHWSSGFTLILVVHKGGLPDDLQTEQVKAMGRISADQAVLTKYSTTIHLELDLSNDITWSSSAQFACCVSRTMQKKKKNLSLPSLNFKPRDVLLLSPRTFYSISWNHPSIHPFFLSLHLRHSGVLEPPPPWTNNCPQPQVLSQCIGCVFGGSQGTLRNPTQTHGEPENRKSPGPGPSWRSKPWPPCSEVLQCQPLHHHRVMPLKPSSRWRSQQELQHTILSLTSTDPPLIYLFPHTSLQQAMSSGTDWSDFTHCHTHSNVSLFEPNICKNHR